MMWLNIVRPKMSAGLLEPMPVHKGPEASKASIRHLYRNMGVQSLMAGPKGRIHKRGQNHFVMESMSMLKNPSLYTAVCIGKSFGGIERIPQQVRASDRAQECVIFKEL